MTHSGFFPCGQQISRSTNEGTGMAVGIPTERTSSRTWSALAIGALEFQLDCHIQAVGGGFW